jgi:hypothetical protein
MSHAVRKRSLLVLVLVLMLAFAANANASIIVSNDGQGRRITFDVRAATADTNWYAAILRATAHGNEISNLTIRIVPDQAIEALCGNEAAACYTHQSGRPTIMVPVGKNTFIEGTLIHEYGHHLDASTPVPGAPELNGTPAWWNARGIGAMFQRGEVAFDYSKGWDHSISEIFAEDYAYIHVGPSYHYGMQGWLKPPDDALKATMFAELGSPTATLPAAPNTPLVIHRVGTLAPRDRKTVPFGLLGPGRRVTFTATVSRQQRKGTRARMQIVCNGSVVATQALKRRQATRTLDVPNLGPADCDARLISTAPVSLKYTILVQLAAPGENGGSSALLR